MMMTPHSMTLTVASAILGLALLSGCAPSRPTQFYTLSSQVSNGELIERKDMRLGVGPVSLPAYLDRPQLVTRNGANQMTVADFDQWAEPLETTFQRVLAENLSTWLATDQIVSLPARRDVPMDHQVEIEVARFDADEAGQAVLDARWRIFDGRGDQLQGSGRSLIRKQAETTERYSDIASAMSQCLGAMSEEIAEALAAL